MTISKRIIGARVLRPLWIAGLLAMACRFDPALANDASLADSAKKVGNNIGELLKGVGQGVKKAGESLSKSGDKDKKKATESETDEQAKDKEKSK